MARAAAGRWEAPGVLQTLASGNGPLGRQRAVVGFCEPSNLGLGQRWALAAGGLWRTGRGTPTALEGSGMGSGSGQRPTEIHPEDGLDFPVACPVEPSVVLGRASLDTPTTRQATFPAWSVLAAGGAA